MDERTPIQSLDRAIGFSVDARTLMQSPNGAAVANQRGTELLLLREAVQWLEQSATLNEKTKQIQERPEEKGTLNREIQDLKDTLEVKERKVNDLQNRMENLQEQLRDKGKQMGSLKGRVKSLQAYTSNPDSALTTLVESLAEKEHIIQRLKEQRFQNDQEKGEELVASRTTLESFSQLRLVRTDGEQRHLDGQPSRGDASEMWRGGIASVSSKRGRNGST
ncbi:unnamed protein product [Arctogadus glacialis]